MTDESTSSDRALEASAHLLPTQVPAQELRTDGIDVDAGVREALSAVSQRSGHDARGRFTSGNTAAGTTLARSEAFWAAVGDAKRELLEQVRRDAGDNVNAAETLCGLQEAYCEARLFRQAMWVRLVELGGPITSKGKARALWTAYCAASDRELKLATTISLERKPKPAQTLADVLEAHEASHGS